MGFVRMTLKRWFHETAFKLLSKWLSAKGVSFLKWTTCEIKLRLN